MNPQVVSTPPRSPQAAEKLARLREELTQAVNGDGCCQTDIGLLFSDIADALDFSAEERMTVLGDLYEGVETLLATPVCLL